MKKIFCILLLTIFTSLPTYSIEPAWLTAACFNMNFAVWDKFGTKGYDVLYKVRSGDGHEFSAKLKASGHNSSKVNFPRDFKDDKSGKDASVVCHGSSDYFWEIYVHGELKERGKVSFNRDH
ncbi:hypothetical protein ACJJI4_04355 [Microbulbifer sp. TRSA002]|uniref:hypothetical protein n=1 Tax=Microbulbifer sp. TRSA002 TaxID=3243382 RepID=UPI00403A561B